MNPQLALALLAGLAAIVLVACVLVRDWTLAAGSLAAWVIIVTLYWAAQRNGDR